MKGIVFNLLEEAVREDFGEDAWDALLAKAELDGVYTSLGTYADEQLGSLVAAASTLLGKPPQDIIRWFGQKAAVQFAGRYPVFFEGHSSTRAFLLTLNDIIHPEVRKLYPGADAPEFVFGTGPSGQLVMDYRSKRDLCSFAEGLILGTAPRFGELAQVEHTSCKRRGDAGCVLRVSFHPAAIPQ